MAKLSSIPVRNNTNTKASPMIPTSSFIFPSGNLHKIAQEYKALDKTADGYRVYKWVKGNLQRCRNLSMISADPSRI